LRRRPRLCDARRAELRVPRDGGCSAWSHKTPMTELLASPGDSLRVFEYTSDVTIAYFFLQRATGDFRQTSMNSKGDLIRGMFLPHVFLPRTAGAFSVHSNPKYRARHPSPTFHGTERCQARGHVSVDTTTAVLHLGYASDCSPRVSASCLCPSPPSPSTIPRAYS